MKALRFLLPAAVAALLAASGCRPNKAPVIESGPTGPDLVPLRRSASFQVVVSDADGDQVQARCDWGNGDTSDWSFEETPPCTLALAHAWMTAGSYDVRCQAMDARSGRSAWSGAKTVVVSSAAPGAVRWTFEAGGDVRGVPALGSDGAVYVASELGYVYALNADGTRRWRAELPDRILSTPALGADGVVYVGTEHYLYALKPDGSVRWRFAAAGPVDAGPALSDDGRV
ncbi:hypothetical protein FJY71_07540, partial [candidate division WOR-3 bacterium]|nr:hypothetical protein [candidate division WOR-3 bacterium]